MQVAEQRGQPVRHASCEPSANRKPHGWCSSLPCCAKRSRVLNVQNSKRVAILLKRYQNESGGPMLSLLAAKQDHKVSRQKGSHCGGGVQTPGASSMEPSPRRCLQLPTCPDQNSSDRQRQLACVDIERRAE